jgi:uncharacterized protein YyaL (SSP411 family)
MTGQTSYEEKADRTLRAFPEIQRNPSAYSMLMAAVDFAIGPSFEIVIAGDIEAEDTREMLRAFQSRYLPHKVLLYRPTSNQAITKLAPFAASQEPLDGQATAYVCRDFACKAPTHDIEEALDYLDLANWD